MAVWGQIVRVAETNARLRGMIRGRPRGPSLDSEENTPRSAVDLSAIDASLSELGPVPGDLAHLMQQYLGESRLNAERADQLLAQLDQPNGVTRGWDDPQPPMAAEPQAPFRPSEPQRAEQLSRGEVQSGELEQLEQFQTGEMVRPDELRSARPARTSQRTRPYEGDSGEVTVPIDMPAHDPLPRGAELQPQAVTIPSGPVDDSDARLLEDGFEILVDDELIEHRSV
jgi:hypothetical protein